MPEILPDVLFYVSLAVAGAGWLALILFPRRAWANLWFAGVVIPALLGILYTVVMLVFWYQPPAADPLNFFSLHGLARMFENRGMLLAAWIDLLVMPLIAGAWMTRRAAQARIPYLYLFVCLVLTLVVPGTGFVVFVVVVGIGGRWKEVARIEGVPAVDSVEVPARPRSLAY